LGPEEEALLSPELLVKAREYVRHLVDEGLRDRDVGRVSDGRVAMARIHEGLRARKPA
jgi:hypothetical protein